MLLTYLQLKSVFWNIKIWPWWNRCSWSSDSLRAGRSVDRIPVEARFPAPVQTGPGDHPTSCTIATRCTSRDKAAGAWRWPPNTSKRRGSRKSRAINLLPSGLSWPVLGWTLPSLYPYWNRWHILNNVCCANLNTDRNAFSLSSLDLKTDINPVSETMRDI